jgi:CheY-like chemotaxis protein
MRHGASGRTFAEIQELSLQRPKDRTKMKHRVLIADDDTHFARRLGDYLADHGYESRVVRTVSEAKEALQFWRPNSIFINLLLPETNAISIVKFISTKMSTFKPRIAIMSKQALPEAVDQLKRAGAEHYLLKPFALEDALEVVTTEPEKERDLTEHTNPGIVSLKELHLLNLILKQAMLDSDSENRLFNLMRMINIKVKAMRCSMIRCLNDETGMVLASNDDESIQGHPIALAEYPEITEVRRRNNSLVIPNVRTSDILAPVHHKMHNLPYETMALFPIHRRGRFFGVLSLRMEQKAPIDITYIEKFGQVCSQIISLSIGTPGQRLFKE